MGHHYDPHEGISFPSGYHPHGYEARSLTDHQAEHPVNQLYSPSLLNLDKQTQQNMKQLRQKLENADACYGLAMEHWHSGKIKRAYIISMTMRFKLSNFGNLNSGR